MAANLPVMYFTTGILFAVILPTMPLANRTADYDYASCSLDYSCGRIQGVGYPFWGDNRPEYCGLPDFRLDCQSSRYPTMWGLNIPGIGPMGGHEVLSINTSNRTIMFALRDQGAACPHALHPWGHGHNFTNKSKPTSFKLGASSQSITLFYGCPNDITTRNHSISFPCQQSEVNAFAYFVDKIPEDGRCNGSVTLPVSKRALERLEKDRTSWMLEQVLTAPFEVVYNLSTFEACLKCQNSGGMCASPLDSSSDQLVCYKPGNRRSGIILGTTAGAMVAIVFLASFWYFRKCKFDQSQYTSENLSLDISTSDLEKGSKQFGVPLFSYRELQVATDNFNESGELGSGGFGRVYYGKLKDGREVAVKLLYEKTNRRVEQFMNEVKILTRLQRPNLVSLYGCTSPQCRELLLVYEYICNGTVADHLYGENSKTGHLSWPTRMRIAIQTAEALSYLHASEIIHRDVKTNNILLDANFSVKVADFGLSRLFPTDVTHVSTAPQGTPGYLDPEYHQCYQLTAKSDVYSFGVVLIELISSLPAVDMNRQKHEINLSNYAMTRIKRGTFEELVDPRLGFESDFRVRRMATSVAELAFQCLQHDKELRPTMDEISQALKMIQDADYGKELHAEEIKGRSDHTTVMRPSPSDHDEENDGAQLLINTIHHHHHHHHHNQMSPPSPNSVTDRWGSRSTTTVSSTSRQGRSNIFCSLSS